MVYISVLPVFVVILQNVYLIVGEVSGPYAIAEMLEESNGVVPATVAAGNKRIDW